MDNLLKVENLFFGYDNKPFLKNINFQINAGEFVSIIGENGSGKSTLFKVLNLIHKPNSGNIKYKNTDIQKMSFRQRAKEFTVIYQNQQCKFSFSCFEIVAMGLYPYKSYFSNLSKTDIEFIKNIMTITDTIQFADKSITCLSGGQAQRVLIARALAQKPKLLFLDEAMSGFDISARIKMTEILKDETQKGLAVLNIQHDLNLAFEKSDKIIALKNGEVYSFGKPKDLLNKKLFKDVFNVDVEIYDDFFRIKA